ncbi:(2Fe-2S) ferredoxin domain-containing protein [Nocardioides sp. NPDC051685]|uniref:(2Fe-2S) ferredoxin domain-containing protein n=1 Tax=Nocardioides sp. NPDC051685 TaxID=3364334 RepID=UPI0037A7BD48
MDHAGLVADLGDHLGSRASLRVTGCLWVCGAANVVVVSPGADARRSGARPVWFARILDPEANAAIASWVHAGGPGLAPLPELLQQHLTLPFRRRRKQVRLTSPDA